MKKITWAILCVFCIAGLGTQAAFAEQVTLPELRAQAPETLELSVPGEDGASVSVCIPVIIPEAEGLHVQKMRPLVMDKTVLLEEYTPVEKNSLGLDGHYEYFCFYRFAPKGKTKIFTDIQAGWFLYKDRQPDNNDLPWGRPAEKLQEIMELCGWEADVRVVWQAATSQGYTARDKLGHSSRGESYAIMVFNERYPVKGYEKGYYQLNIAQYFDGVRIFGSNYGCTIPPIEGASGNTMSANQILRMNVLSEEDFGIFMELLETEQVIRRDVPMATFDVIQKSIEKRISEGKLKTVYRLELGYAHLNVLSADETNVQDAGDRRTLLVPAWCVSGFDTKDDSYRAQYEYTVPTEQEYWESGNRFELWLDAETGDPLQYNPDVVNGI